MWRQRSLALCSSTREGQVGLPSCDVLMPGAAEEGEALLKPLSGRGPSLTLIAHPLVQLLLGEQPLWTRPRLCAAV